MKDVRIDAFRRNLQRAYIDTLAERINGRQAASDDARALFRQELRLLEDALRGATGRAVDGVSRAHIADAQALVARALDPAVQAAAPAGAARTIADGVAIADLEDAAGNPADAQGCWPDYAIVPSLR